MKDELEVDIDAIGKIISRCGRTLIYQSVQLIQEIDNYTTGMIISRNARTVAYQSVQLGQEIPSVGDSLHSTFDEEMAHD